MKRQWLYNKEGGKLFEGEDKINQALESGYVDSPAKVGKEEKPKKTTRARKPKAVVEEEDL